MIIWNFSRLIKKLLNEAFTMQKNIFINLFYFLMQNHHEKLKMKNE
jgi:hypothetical protein